MNRPPYQILAFLIATFTVFAALYGPSLVALPPWGMAVKTVKVAISMG